jgi:hypothetical protein
MTFLDLSTILSSARGRVDGFKCNPLNLNPSGSLDKFTIWVALIRPLRVSPGTLWDSNLTSELIAKRDLNTPSTL